MKNYQFTAIIEAPEVGKGGAHVCFLYDGCTCYIFGILKSVQKGFNKDIGDKVKVALFKRTDQK